jgi:hypothetical protein
MKAITSIDRKTNFVRPNRGHHPDGHRRGGQEKSPFDRGPGIQGGLVAGRQHRENAGGPFCFEYGTTLDNIHSYTMVLPDARVIEGRRRDHPRTRSCPRDAVFDIFDESGPSPRPSPCAATRFAARPWART